MNRPTVDDVAHPIVLTVCDEPFPDLSLYDAAEINEAADMIQAEFGPLIFSTRYKLAAKLLDLKAGRRR